MSVNYNKPGSFCLPAKSGKRAVVFAPFFSDKAVTNRPFIVSMVLSRFKTVDIVTTNFDHQTKNFKKESQLGDNRTIHYLKTLKYTSNISMARFLSHLIFSLKAVLFFMKRRNEYDLIYVTLPLNLVALLVFPLCRHHRKIADVVDIWPDVLPFPSKMKMALAPAFIIWRKCFQLAINKSDVLMAVSDYFLEQSLKHFKNDQRFSKRFYIGHRLLQVEEVPKGNKLKIAYIGNIGHLYDFKTLLEALALEKISDKYELHIIGDGDKRKWLLDELERRRLKYAYYGVVYDEQSVAKILSACHIGFNGYINTAAAFSYKANTYLAARLPIINSMPGDLETVVSKYGIGCNYIAGNVESLTRCLSGLDQNRLSKMSELSFQFFKKEIDQDKIMNDIESFIKSLMIASCA